MNYNLSIRKLSVSKGNSGWLSKIDGICPLCNMKISFSKDANGKPIVISSNRHYVSGSHSGDYIATVVSHSATGVDIEFKKNRAEELIYYIADNCERELLENIGSESLLACWTAKEAAQKADAFISDIRTYKIVKIDANKLSFGITRDGKYWNGKWIINKEFVCTVAVED